MSEKKCKWTAPNGQEYECKPSLICGDCENNNIKYWCPRKDDYCGNRNCYNCEFLDKEVSAEAIEKAKKKNEIEMLRNAYEAGKMLQYQKENGEWVDFSKNTVCDDFKFQEHLNYRIKPAYDHKSFSDKKSDGVYIRNYEYTKIQNYIEAIRLIAEKVKTAESDCIEQLARDVGNYLYDLVKGDKNE